MPTLTPVTSVTPGADRRLRRLVFELSPKPFRDPTPAGTEAVAREIISQYHALIQSADALSFMFWTADGSEILDYRGCPDNEIRWARYIGIANDAPPGTIPGTLHGTPRVPYCDNPPPPPLTYGRLRDIIETLRRIATETTGKPVTFGTTFDPGPEFADSDFKYKRHPEINKGAIMGHKQWLHCASSLHADAVAYAGFPNGIPEGTPLGTFLGRQARHFMRDVGFDYIWFSNGFGFSLDSWNCTGEVFDGTRFDTSGAPAVNRSILKFWQDFRAECPDHPIHTRGSNLSTAMDLAAHASPIRDIYTGGFNLIAPVNSPWAALNHDYGLELVGWMSHIAELPETVNNEAVNSETVDGKKNASTDHCSLITDHCSSVGYPFRYYIHDPWWLNSPWLDRYGREPHDIYLPLACARIAPDGRIVPPDSLSLLTIDDSYGRLPREVPNEITPHIQRALADFSDAPGLLTWVYPFDEYHDQTFATPSRASEVFFGDWFMRTAVNAGLPLNTVVSTKNYLATRSANPALYAQTNLVTPAPDAGTPLSDALLAHIRSGSSALLYGPLTHADPALLTLLNLRTGAAPLDGEFLIETTLTPDTHRDGSSFPQKLNYRPLLNGGPIDTDWLNRDAGVPPASVVETLATVTCPRTQATRPFAVTATLPDSGGRLIWIRGALSETVKKSQAHLPTPDDPAEWAHTARLMRWALEKTGYIIRFDKTTPATKDPLILCARSRGGWIFSGFTTNTTTALRWRFPQGVPVPIGADVAITANGIGETHTPAAWHRECRVLVEQATPGDVSCREHHSGEIGITRRLRITGLKNATITFLPDTDFPPEAVRIQKDQGYLGTGPAIPFRRTAEGHCVTTEPVTGEIFCSW
ncbi:hypothetical protein [Geminisphaera colitermitum]|uniref:hypothetical protein n=1 Tax=Geminisphaera colitermitum TaxID=1148786 RepID=UPI000158D010|nr:hypothetical protein [Geminisphaera colitermitum]